MTRRVMLAAVAAVLFTAAAPSPAVAQEDTFVTFCIVPKIGTGTFLDSWRPAYIADMGPDVIWTAMDYGDEATMLVGAFLTQAQIDFVAAQPDAFVIPPMDTAVGGNPMLNRVRNFLEGRSVPGSWIQSSTTWRATTGRVGRVCLVMQRMNGIGKKVFGPGVTLDSALPQLLLEGLIAAGSSLGLDTSGLSLSMTVRAALLYLADQLPPFFLGGETF